MSYYDCPSLLPGQSFRMQRRGTHVEPGSFLESRTQRHGVQMPRGLQYKKGKSHKESEFLRSTLEF